jgi:hypothetical protein
MSLTQLQFRVYFTLYNMQRNLNYIIFKKFSYNCNIYTDNCPSTLIIYCIGITIFPIVDVLGLYNYN